MFFQYICICKVGNLKVNRPNPKTVNSQYKYTVDVGFQFRMAGNGILRIHFEHGRCMFRVPIHWIM